MAEGFSDSDGTVEDLRRYLGELGYERAVVFAPLRGSAWREHGGGDPNEWLFNSIEGDSRFIPWITVNEAGPEAAARLEESAKRGARGIKFHPAVARIAIADPSLEEFYSLAEKLSLPVLFHTGPHGWLLDKYRPLRVDEVAYRHPRLPLIIEHLGGAGLVRETYAVLQNGASVYGGLTTCLPTDATWHVPAAEVKSLLDKFGAERFVFGSDYPYNAVEANRRALKVLKEMGLSSADLSLVVSGNLERLDSLAG